MAPAPGSVARSPTSSRSPPASGPASRPDCSSPGPGSTASCPRTSSPTDSPASTRAASTLDEQAVQGVRPVFDRHPSEASGLLVAAACGRRGVVEVRDAGDQVVLTDATTALSAVDGKDAAATTPAAWLAETSSLDEAARIIREVTTISEIDYETAKAARVDRRPAHAVTEADLPVVDRHAAEARGRGADFVSLRRLSELLGVSTLATHAQLSTLLATHRPDSYEPSLYRTTPRP